MSDDIPRSRWKFPSRDHLIQVILIVIIVPLAVWGIDVNRTIAVFSSRLDGVERMVVELQADRKFSTAQILDMNTQLAKISAQLEDIRELERKRK
ncbi:MAG: hypothetical protein EPO09_21755 [Aquabacterium sp.]|uniref:hypothetical protein n=1 Tax=Aquabacterium sp. TaxID=1872578 RepID=UPI001221CFC7|nr:hypothetical protein [Aquabacterium sp.]TAK81879.1 MAG: hypothetical protein EPO09_21755 [Aquabacterium sp.]